MGACWSSGCLVALAPDYGVSGSYTLVRHVGGGGEAEVWLGEELASKQRFALKMIPRGIKSWQAAAVSREVQCSLELGATHVNVIRPLELLLTKTHVVLATQYARGGTLAGYCDKHKIDEPAACYFFRQFCAALAHCHARKICFRDVKLENMLLDDAVPPNLQLCDFGVARRWTNASGSVEHGKMNTLAGTPGFLAPQVLGVLFEGKGGSGYDGAAADVWSAGVVLVVMLLHHLPFGYDSIASSLEGPGALRTAWETELRMRWRAGDAALTRALSADVLDLLDRMLEPDECKRITMDGVRAHAWYNQQLPPPMEAALAVQVREQAKLAGCDAECDLHGTDAAIDELCMKALSKGSGANGIEARLSLVPDDCRRRSLEVSRCSLAAEDAAKGESANGAA